MRFIGNFFFYLFVVGLSLVSLGIVGYFVFEPKIKDQFLKSLEPFVNARLEVDFIQTSFIENFPQASIKLKGVRIGETNDSTSANAYEVGSMFILFNLKDVFAGDWRARHIMLDGAEITMEVAPDGTTNFEFWPTDSVSQDSSVLSFNLDRVDVTNSTYSFQDHRSGFLISTQIDNGTFELHTVGDKTDLVVEAAFNIHDLNSGELAILKDKGLSSKLGFTIKDGDVYSISDGKLEVEGMQFDVDGTIDNSQEHVVTDLDIIGTQTELHDLIALSPGILKGSLDDYEIDGASFFNAKLRGAWTEDQAAGMLIGFGIRDGHIAQKSTGLKFDGINLEGSFSNGKGRTMSSSTLALRNIKATESKKKIQGNFTLTNFDRPYLDFALKADVDLGRLHGIFHFPGIETVSGNLSSDVSFKGRLKDLEDPQTIVKTDFAGDLVLENVVLQQEGDPLNWESLNGTLSFEKPFLLLNEITGKRAYSDFKLDGYVKNPFAFLASQSRLHIMTDVESNLIRLQDFLSSDTSSSDGSEIERWPNYLLVSANLSAKSFEWDDLRANQVDAKINYAPHHLEIVSADMISLGGRLNLSGIIKEVLPSGFDVLGKVQTDSLDISQLFLDLDNFGQEYVTHNHLKGLVAGTMNASFETDADFEIMTKSFVGDADIELVDGELIGFLPMMKVGNFMKVGHFEHIVFDTLVNHFYIEDEQIQVPKMKIRSNTLDMTIAGTHSFENEIDYKLKVNLKKLFMSQNKLNPLSFTGFEKSDRGGFNVFLLATGPGDDPDLKYDLMAAGDNLGDNMKNQLKEISVARERENQLRNDRQDSIAQYHRRLQSLRRKKAYKNAIFR